MPGESLIRLRIRAANPSDAKAIIEVHYAAVHETASGSYPRHILEAWSATPGKKRFEWMRKLIASGDEIIIVGEDASKILGFGIVIPKVEELRALYVHPAAGRRGIGKQILHSLENRAGVLGISLLWLNASLNAEAFYRSYGYTSLARGKFRLPAGPDMNCVKMEKRLDGNPPETALGLTATAP